MPEEARISSNEPAGPAARYLSTEAAATYLAVSRKTLEKWRLTGGGPPFCQIKRAVRYDRTALDAWMAAHSRESTSDGRR